MKTIEHFVGGKSFSGDSKRIGKVFNPKDGSKSTLQFRIFNNTKAIDPYIWIVK